MNDSRNLNKNDNMRGDCNLNQKGKDCSKGECNNVEQRSNIDIGLKDDFKGQIDKTNLGVGIEDEKARMDNRGMSGQMKK
jgi:hypothetical protein